MPVDSSIYFQQQPIDILGNVQKGMALGQNIQDRKVSAQDLKWKNEAQAVYGLGIKQNPDGSTSYEPGLVLGGIKNGDPNNPYLQKLGFDMSQTMRTQGIQDQEMILKQQADQRAADLQRVQMDKMRAEIRELDRKPTAKMLSGEGLPLDQKKMVETLSTKNANKIAIKNQIDAVMAGWDELPDDQKLAAGRQLLKTLNSTEGADAIGVEEANRLGSKLEFAMGNLTNSNPIQFGRDLPGFAEQARNTSKSIGDAVGSNQKQIDTYMGRRPSDLLNPVRVIAPDGSVRLLPKSQVQAALNAGGKLAD